MVNNQLCTLLIGYLGSIQTESRSTYSGTNFHRRESRSMIFPRLKFVADLFRYGFWRRVAKSSRLMMHIYRGIFLILIRTMLSLFRVDFFRQVRYIDGE